MTQPDQQAPSSFGQPALEPENIVFVSRESMAIENDDHGEPQQEQRPITELVDQPAKVMRIGSMIKQLLEEVRTASLDEKSRVRLKEIHRRSITELEDGLAPELIAELERVSLPFGDDDVPSEAELRVAQAQLVGWLEGLFHGIQTALFAQQVVAQAQIEDGRRRALPPGLARGGPAPEEGAEGTRPQRPGPGGTGQYL